MEPELIVAIVAGGLFLILFLIFLIVSAHRRKLNARLKEHLEEVYSDENLVKMEYDFAECDDVANEQPGGDGEDSDLN